VAHPTDSSTLSLRLFSHVTNLPDNRLSNVTRKKIRGELPRTPLLDTWVNKGMREGRSWCAPAFVMKTSVTYFYCRSPQLTFALVYRCVHFPVLPGDLRACP